MARKFGEASIQNKNIGKSWKKIQGKKWGLRGKAKTMFLFVKMKIPYLQQKSNIFGIISRPLVTIKVYSKTKNIWIPVYDALADTGADITLFPRYLGEMVVDDITKGKYVEIRGIASNAVVVGFMHKVKLEVFHKQIEASLVIADTDDVRPVLGRLEALDLFKVVFDKGKFIEINE